MGLDLRHSKEMAHCYLVEPGVHKEGEYQCSGLFNYEAIKLSCTQDGCNRKRNCILCVLASNSLGA